MRRSFLIGCLAIAGVLAACHGLRVRWNMSASVAPGLYLELAGPPARGDLVTVCLPEAVARWARGRGYLRRGHCPGESGRLGKWIAAVEGDRVEVRSKGTVVNGLWLEGSRRVDYDSKGRKVPLVPEGEVVLRPGQVWLHSGRSARSFDSRVFGPLEVDRVQGVLEPLWTLGQD